MTTEEIAQNLANAMARHIIGETFAARDETCAECIRIATEAIASAIRAEREKAEKAEAERDRLRAELDGRRMCVNCGTFAPVGHTRNHPLPECVGPDGLSACTFDLTPKEAWQHWSVEAHKLRAERDRLRGECHQWQEEAGAMYVRAEQLEDELEKYQKGYKGACYACEPVGMLNQKQKDTIDALVGAATPILDTLEASFPVFAAFGEFRALRTALEKAKG